MDAKCSCGLVWNVSIKTDLCKPYICPVCENKVKKPNVSKALIKNKNKFERND